MSPCARVARPRNRSSASPPITHHAPGYAANSRARSSTASGSKSYVGSAKREPQAGARPFGREKLAGAGQRHVRSAQVVATEADVRGEGIGGGDVLDLAAVRRDRRDAPVHEGGHADPAVSVDGERVEQLIAREAGKQGAATGP